MTDAAGRDAVQTLTESDRLKLLDQVTPNISRARNMGIGAASGEVVGFIDDDAVPEPSWADAMLRAFEDPDLAAATGPVLGRNGISLQWGPIDVDRLAVDHQVDPDMQVRDGVARKLHGTNMAVRRSVLEQLGGFDEAFEFYLDDTDLSFRLADAGYNSACLPDAVVHHSFLASVRRTSDRVPLSLFDIGASTAVYLRKHAEGLDHSEALRALEAQQSTRLMRLARQRRLNSQKMRALMESLKSGIEAGTTREIRPGAIGAGPRDFRPLLLEDPPPPSILAGRLHERRRLRAEAQAMVAAGQPVSLFIFEPTPRKHKILYADGGWWEQYGGLYGPSERDEPRLTFSTFRRRLAKEVRRVSAARGL